MEWNSLQPQLHLTKKEKQMEPVIPFVSYMGGNLGKHQFFSSSDVWGIPAKAARLPNEISRLQNHQILTRHFWKNFRVTAASNRARIQPVCWPIKVSSRRGAVRERLLWARFNPRPPLVSIWYIFLVECRHTDEIFTFLIYLFVPLTLCGWNASFVNYRHIMSAHLLFTQKRIFTRHMIGNFSTDFVRFLF